MLFVKHSRSLRKPKGPLELWLDGEKHKSATLQARNELDALAKRSIKVEERLEERYEKLRNYSSIAILAVLVGLITCGMYFFYWFSDRYTELVSKSEQAICDSRRVQEQQKEITRLADGLRQAEQKLKAIEEKSPRR